MLGNDLDHRDLGPRRLVADRIIMWAALKVSRRACSIMNPAWRDPLESDPAARPVCGRTPIWTRPAAHPFQDPSASPIRRM